jgi:long-chain acyl-CoA synthetase
VRRRPPLHYPDRPFQHFLQDAADRRPEEIGLDFEGQCYTYREMDGIGNAFGHAAVEMGIRPGDRVALVVSNRPEWIFAAHGLFQAGASVVMPNPVWKEEELRHALDLTDPVAVVGEASATAVLDRIRPSGPRVSVDVDGPAGWSRFWDLVASHPGQRLPDLDRDLATAEAALPFSSGTTGLPKAVRHSHRSIVAGTLNWKSANVIGERDRLQFFLPLFGIYGICIVAGAIQAGARLTLFRRFDLDTMLRHIHEERVTIGYGALPIAVAMANHPDLESYDLSCLRYFLWAATPISPDVAQRVSERTGIRWLHGYGCTEVPGLFCNVVNEPDTWRLDTPGIAISDLDVRIVDPQTGDDVVPGAEGEIVVRAPHVMLGYLPPEANAEAFWPGGWFRTGDIGWLEPEGWLHITDRAKEMIKVSGFSVAPVEIERCLYQHPAVADCAVYSVPDPAQGEVPKAAVVVRDGTTVTEDELKAFVAERLSSYKHLRHVAFVDAVPRNPSGKVLRRILKEADPAARPTARV